MSILSLNDGLRVQLSTAKFLTTGKARDFEAARGLLRSIGSKIGFVARLAEYAPASPLSPVAPEDSNNVTVERAVAAFMADSRDRGNSDATLQKKATVFERRTARDPKNRGKRDFLSGDQPVEALRPEGHPVSRELDLNTIRDWRSDWKVNSFLRQKRQAR